MIVMKTIPAVYRLCCDIYVLKIHIVNQQFIISNIADFIISHAAIDRYNCDAAIICDFLFKLMFIK